MIQIKLYIEYYYNIDNINILKSKESYKFIYKNQEYLFMVLKRSPIEILQINRVINNNSNYGAIISNIKNELITNVNGKNYILIRVDSSDVDLYAKIEKANIVYLPHDMIGNIIKSNWSELWSKKIDYIEYQLNNIDINPLLLNSIWYYIGMAENAITYINDTMATGNKHNLYISHKRIKSSFFNNPQNLIVDYRSRDISEYLKYLFIENNYDYVDIKNKLNKLNLDEFLCRLIYGRMFFVTFYFDLFDAIINNIESKESLAKLKNIISRTAEYEDYINSIYDILYQIKKIPKVDWV